MKRLAFWTVAATLVAAAAAIPASAQRQGNVSLRDLNMDYVPRLDTSGVYRVQQLLKERGFDPGRVDGVFGPLTRGAVTRFQDAYAIKSAGEIDNQTLFALGATDLAGAESGQGR